jgi:cytochrome c oxidase assembly factor CtaG
MKSILSYWSCDYALLGILIGICILYALLAKFTTHSILYFVIAALLISLCFFSPLHILSAQYLFSVHMIVHVILLLCVGPLLLLCLSPEKPVLPFFFLFLKNYPVVSWLTGVGIMWIWHIPVLFNATMGTMHGGCMGIMHSIETISLIFSGIIFTAPVIHPDKNFRIDALPGVVYLFTACVGCSILGLLITFAPVGTYQHFLSAGDEYGLNNTILQQWHITQLADQQAAGLIMWVPCCLIYVSGSMYLLMHWFEDKEQVKTIDIKLNEL